MVKVALVKEKQGERAKARRGAFSALSPLFSPLFSPLLYPLRPLELLPLSGLLPGQRQIEFWQAEENFYQNPHSLHGKWLTAAEQEGIAAETNFPFVKWFAQKLAKNHVAVCGGQGWNYFLQQQLEQWNDTALFTGGFSLSLFIVLDFLLCRSHLWRRKDIAVLDGDNPLGRFAALCLAREARLLLLTGKNKGALELLSEEIFQKTGLAVRIVSEEKALQWGEMFFLAGEKKEICIPGVQWDLAAICGLRDFSYYGKMESRFLYPAYHREKYLSGGWCSAVLLAQCEEEVRRHWRQMPSSEKVYFWQQRFSCFDISPVFFFQKENGQKFYQLFGRENLF